MADRSVRSLAGRLIFSATVLCLLVLLVAGVVLSEVNRRSAVQSFDQRLGLYMKVLVADVAAMTEGAEVEPGNLGEPQLQIPLSGWYWQIFKLDQEKETAVKLRASRSLLSGRLPFLVDPHARNRTNDFEEGYLLGPEGKRLRVVEQLIDLGDESRFYISVAGNADEIKTQTNRFNLALVGTFSLLAAALIGSTILQVRYGLQPLSQLRQSVGAIRQGEAETIAGTYPEEVSPLVFELNQMIDANREVVGRARMQVGNLAHALKTPISVLVNEAAEDDSALALKLREQTAIMKDQVQYYLDRARAAARAATIGSVTEIDPVVAAFLRTFQKIYRSKAVDFTADIEPGLRFRGERQDFEDLVGNLMDNAGKWAKSSVHLTIRRDPSAGQSAFMLITIDDDGPGLPEQSRQEATRRGRRLDESKPGSGLGLSIVVDLTSLYGGSFQLDSATMGGLRARLRLPCV